MSKRHLPGSSRKPSLTQFRWGILFLPKMTQKCRKMAYYGLTTVQIHCTCLSFHLGVIPVTVTTNVGCGITITTVTVTEGHWNPDSKPGLLPYPGLKPRTFAISLGENSISRTIFPWIFFEKVKKVISLYNEFTFFPGLLDVLPFWPK